VIVQGNGGIAVGVGIIVGSVGIPATIVSVGSNASLVVAVGSNASLVVAVGSNASLVAAVGEVLLQPAKKNKQKATKIMKESEFLLIYKTPHYDFFTGN
jgi:hypothetical protein